MSRWSEHVKRVAQRKRRRRGAWYVYLMQVVSPQGDRAYKIGIAVKPEKRQAEMQVSCPWKMAITHRFRRYGYEKALSTEQVLHRLFQAKSIQGEWFMLSEEDIGRIEDYFARNRNIYARKN